MNLNRSADVFTLSKAILIDISKQMMVLEGTKQETSQKLTESQVMYRKKFKVESVPLEDHIEEDNDDDGNLSESSDEETESTKPVASKKKVDEETVAKPKGGKKRSTTVTSTAQQDTRNIGMAKPIINNNKNTIHHIDTFLANKSP